MVDELRNNFKTTGQLAIYFTKNINQKPIKFSSDKNNGVEFRKKIEKWYFREIKYFNGNDGWEKTGNWYFSSIPHGIYNVQIVWNQNGSSDSSINSPGSLFSEVVKLNTKESKEVRLILSKIIPEEE